MSKVGKKSAPSASKSSKSDVLSKVKGASVTKPAQGAKARSKEVAKEVAAKSQKKDKKNKKIPVKEPTPEPESESEEDESEESEGSGSSSEEESDIENEVKKNKANGVKIATKDESEDESSEESDSEDEVPKVKGASSNVKPASDAPKTKDDASEEDSSEEESDEDEKPTVNGAVKAKAASKDDDESEDEDSEESDSDEEETPAVKTNGIKQAKADKAVDEDASSDEDAGSKEDGDNSSDSDESEEDEEPEAKPAKRKAEGAVEPTAKKSRVDTDEKEPSANLFVGNLSWNVDEEWLKSEFEEFGEIAGVRLITNRDDGRSKGYGYVEFVAISDAMKAFAAKKGTELDGRPLNIDYANAKTDSKERQQTRGQRFGDQLSEPSDTLFLGNLSFEATEDDVYNMFAPFGTATGVRIPTNPEDGSVKGFGYVTFASVDEAQAALEGAQGSFLKNRPVRVDYASSRRQDGGGSPGRGGFGGRGGRGGFGGRGGRGGGRGDFGGFGGRGGRGGGRGRGGPRGGRGGSTNRGGFGDFSGTKVTF